VGIQAAGRGEERESGGPASGAWRMPAEPGGQRSECGEHSSERKVFIIGVCLYDVCHVGSSAISNISGPCTWITSPRFFGARSYHNLYISGVFHTAYAMQNQQSEEQRITCALQRKSPISCQAHGTA